MDKHARIATLVRGLLDDKLSPQELRELQQLFFSAEAEGEADLWLNDLWEDSGQREGSMDSYRVLAQLNRKIQLSQKKNTAVRKDNEYIPRFVRSVMRYAAVFVVAISLSWYWFRSDEPETKKQVARVVTSTGINEVSVTYGSKTRIVLPDSSIVYLNSGSKLSYPPVFDAERHVTLTGEGYFVVRSDSLHPFLVHTSEVSVKALGTEFNVKAYPEEKSVETMLVKGSVEILKKNQTKPIVELMPGEKAVYVKTSAPKPTSTAKETPRMEVAVEEKPDLSIGWVQNQLMFDAEPFEQIAVRLERWYNVEIDICNEGLGKARLSGRYDTENIEQVMHSLQMTTPFSYQIEKNRIIIQ